MEFDVNYYDEEHEFRLHNHPYSQQIKRLINNGLKVDENELVVYSIFREQKNYPGWRNYQELKEHLPLRIDTFRKYFDLSGKSLRARFPAKDFDTVQTESAGVATSLFLMNEIYGLHEADWERIPITSRMKTLDFQLASNGSIYIQVESKGTIFDTGTLPKNKDLKDSIEEKKEEQRKKFAPSTSFFGVITGIPHHFNTTAQCLLLDPDGETHIEDPEKYQLLARLHFYMNNLRTISRSHVVMALRNRIQILEASDKYTDLNKISLVDVYGEELEAPSPSIYNKTYIGEYIAGNMFPISRTEFFYSAFDLDIYRMMVKQNFEEIRAFRSKLIEIWPKRTRVRARVNIGDVKKYEMPLERFTEIPKTNEAFVDLEGDLHIGKSGRVIGFFAFPK